MPIIQDVVPQQRRPMTVVISDSYGTQFGHIISSGRAVNEDENALIEGPTTRAAIRALGFKYKRGEGYVSADGRVTLRAWSEAR